jgi:hypothetical protein
MDYGRGGPWGGWEMGRPRGRILPGKGKGWATDFSCFRYAIPEVAGFRGRALYLDSDMLVLGDLRELAEVDMSHPWMITPGSSSVALIDCAWFADKDWWPRLTEMKQSGWNKSHYLGLLERHGAFGALSRHWNCLDGEGFHPERTKLVHFTALETQPWLPYPERIRYRAHPRVELVESWWHHYLAGRRALDSARAELVHDRRFPGPDHERWLSRRRLRIESWQRARAGDGEPPGRGIVAAADAIAALVRRHRARRLLDYGAGAGFQYAPASVRGESPLGAELATRLGERASLAELWACGRPE